MRRGGTQTAPEVLLFIADVTQRREAEEALKATVRELEESRRQMVMAQRMHSIGRLAGGVAHDFNNLLTVIISFTRFVMDDLGSQDPRRADLVEVLKASDSASKLTRQLLAFSSQQSSEPVLTDLNPSTTRFARVLQRTLPESIHLRIVESATPVLEDLKTPIDLLVTDIMLPGIDGMQLALRLRAAQPELRVLVCSGHAGNAHAAALTVDQRTAFLPKPFTGVELSAAAAALVE
jgi:CheY-like chemotaxis protein